MAPPPHPDGQSLRALAWRWRNELEKSSAGMTDLARLTHVHTLEEARTIPAVKTLADDLKDHADADTIAVIAAALALIRDDRAFTAAQLAGRKSRNSAPALREPAFRTLLQTPRDSLIEPLRRLLTAIPDRRADRRALAADIAAWTPPVLLRWTDDYLGCRTEPELAVAYERTEIA